MLKRLFIYAFVAVFLGIGSNLLFTCYLNPDYNFFGRVADASRSWAQHLREKHPKVYVVAGGSSARTGIDPQILMDEYEIPFINAAMGAGYGFDCNVALGWEFVRAHDTLILAMELGLVAERNARSTHDYGIRMLLHQQGIGVFSSPFLKLDWKNRLSPLGTSSSIVASYVTRRLTRRKDEIFAYDKHARIHPSGWMEVTRHNAYLISSHLPENLKSLTDFDIMSDTRDSYERVKQECHKHHVRLIAMIPRYYAHESMKVANLWIALQITRMGIDVLYDPELSVISSIASFSDTVNHLNKEGTVLNTRQVGESLTKQLFWTEEELVTALEERGWDKDGKRLKKPL